MKLNCNSHHPKVLLMVQSAPICVSICVHHYKNSLLIFLRRCIIHGRVPILLHLIFIANFKYDCNYRRLSFDWRANYWSNHPKGDGQLMAYRPSLIFKKIYIFHSSYYTFKNKVVSILSIYSTAAASRREAINPYGLGFVLLFQIESY